MKIKKINLDDIYTRVAENKKTTPETVKRITEHLFKTIRRYIEYPLFPIIQIGELFTVTPDLKALLTKKYDILKAKKMGFVGQGYPDHILNTLEMVIKRINGNKRLPYKFYKHERERQNQREESNA